MERSKGSRLKGLIESPNALRWRLGQLLRCAFTEKESSKIKIGKLGPLPSNVSDYDIAILDATVTPAVYFLTEDLETRSLIEGAAGRGHISCSSREKKKNW
jgi:hypothetical protein